MRVTVLHSSDALEPPVDPVLEHVARALRGHGHTVSTISAAADVVPVVQALRDQQPDLVFNLAESFAGISALESNVAALLNLLDLRYTGSSPAGLLLAGDKSLTKKLLRVHGIRTPEFATVYRGSLDWAGDIEFPVIVKPPQEDASIGITGGSVVSDLKELFGRIDALQSEFRQPVLVEEFVDGREFYVGVLGNMEARALPVIELDFSGLPAGAPRIASWEAKWGADGSGAGPGAAASAEFAGTQSVFPTDLDPELAERMQQVAIASFHALRLRDYGRVDLRVNGHGEIFVLEVNPNCYLERDAEYARAALKDGIAYPELIGRIVELASARYAR
ncbi:MAG TPA: ATP-grasp domain-containing protein [Gemmatimonadaceae bacterium]|nr:ATP-grasp domain-containing protein [Gemmatimonadaceae bacterium]